MIYLNHTSEEMSLSYLDSAIYLSYIIMASHGVKRQSETGLFSARQWESRVLISQHDKSVDWTVENYMQSYPLKIEKGKI